METEFPRSGMDRGSFWFKRVKTKTNSNHGTIIQIGITCKKVLL